MKYRCSLITYWLNIQVANLSCNETYGLRPFTVQHGILQKLRGSSKGPGCRLNYIMTLASLGWTRTSIHSS